MKKSLYTIREAAELLTLKEHTVYLWALNGKIASKKIGTRSVRIPQSEIERILGSDELRKAEDKNMENTPDLRDAEAKVCGNCAWYGDLPLSDDIRLPKACLQILSIVPPEMIFFSLKKKIIETKNGHKITWEKADMFPFNNKMRPDCGLWREKA